MKRNVIIFLIVLLVAGAITTVVLLVLPYMPKYNWSPTLSLNSDQPYGTSYTFRIMKETGLFKKFKKIDKSITTSLPETNNNALYIFIGARPYYDSLEVKKLMKFVSAGNDVLLILEEVPEELGKKFFDFPDSSSGIDRVWDSVVTTSFTDSNDHNPFKFHFQFYKKSIPIEWEFVHRHWFYDTITKLPSRILSTIGGDKVNFWKFRYGKGSIYMHTNPLFFTNYYMVSEMGYRYLNTLFTHLGTHKTGYWDEYSKLMDFGGRNFAPNPLKFILSQRSLRLAYYLTLGLILIFLVTRIRRIQRPMPIQSENRNTSIRFAEAVGTLHYQSGNHVLLARQMMGLFLAFVRQRYNISTNLEEADLIIQIARHSEVEKGYIERIFKELFHIKYNPVPDKIQAVQLHTYLEYFYKNCK